MRITRQEFGRWVTEGMRQLWLALGDDPSEGAVTRLAARLGQTTGTTVKWLYGDRRPGFEGLAEMSELGISADMFRRPPDGEFPVAEAQRLYKSWLRSHGPEAA